MASGGGGLVVDQVFLWMFIVAATVALVGYPLVADAETGEFRYESLTQFQKELGYDWRWLMDKKKGAAGALVGISAVVGLAIGYLVPKVSREGVNN